MPLVASQDLLESGQLTNSSSYIVSICLYVHACTQIHATEMEREEKLAAGRWFPQLLLMCRADLIEAELGQ